MLQKLICIVMNVTKLLFQYFENVTAKNDKVKQDSDIVKTENCPKCEKAITKPNLQYHLYQMHKIGGFICDICSTRKFSKGQLERHKTTHFDVKSFSCDQCGKLFKSRLNLVRHKSAVHCSNDQKRFHCPKCGKGFTTKQSLEGHVNSHLGLKPYKCNLCGDGFQNASNKNAHVKKVHVTSNNV